MINLENKTLFVSGASRGIGLAIAKRAAKDGANVILAAKTAEPHPKLPGTIYTAADEIEAARVESGGYDDSALRTQLREQQELLRQMSSRLDQGTTDQGSMQDAFSEFIGAQQQGVSADVMSQLLSQANQGRVSATDIQNIVNASSAGR